MAVEPVLGGLTDRSAKADAVVSGPQVVGLSGAQSHEKTGGTLMVVYPDQVHGHDDQMYVQRPIFSKLGASKGMDPFGTNLLVCAWTVRHSGRIRGKRL